MRPRSVIFVAAIGVTLLLPAVLPAQIRYWDPVFPQIEVKPDITYGSAVSWYTQQKVTLQLDLYLPKGDTETARPAVVLIHGGNWCAGSRQDQVWVNLGKDFAARGYVAASISYRLAPSCSQVNYAISPFEAMDDTKAAIRFLRRYAATYGVDPDRITGIGHSAGAYSVNGAAYFNAPGGSGNPGYPHKFDVACELSGGLPGYLHEVETGEAPLCVVHGDQDTVVGYGQATALVARCKAVGVPVELHTLVGKGHGILQTDYDNIRSWALAWFYRHLKLAGKAGLAARPGYGSPGKLTLDLAGPAGMAGILLVSAGTASIGSPWGVLRLNLALGFPMGIYALPAKPEVAGLPIPFTVPAGLAGASLYWQAVLIDPVPALPDTFTNLVTTGFK